MGDSNQQTKTKCRLLMSSVDEVRSRLRDSEDNASESLTHVSRSSKCDVRCAASCCPRHRHGVKHRPGGDLCSLLRFSRELLAQARISGQEDAPAVNKPEENLGNGDGDDETQDAGDSKWETDPFEMLKDAMDKLKPETVEHKYKEEDTRSPFPQFDQSAPDEEDSIYSEMDSDSDKREMEYSNPPWRCTSTIGVQTEPPARDNYTTVINQSDKSIKHSNSVVIPVNSNMQLSITVVPMLVAHNPGNGSVQSVMHNNSAGDSATPKAINLYPRKHNDIVPALTKSTHCHKRETIQTIDELQQENDTEEEFEKSKHRDESPTSASETLVDNDKCEENDGKSDHDNVSVKSKVSRKQISADNCLEYPIKSPEQPVVKPPITFGGCDGMEGRYGDCSAIFQPQKFAQAMRYRTHTLQTRCVRTMSQVRRQFQREFAPLHDELSYIQNRVRCIFRYTGGIDIKTTKIPEEMQRSAVLSTIFRRSDPFGEPEIKRSWPDHIRKFPSCSVCSSFSAVAVPKIKKSSENIWNRESAHARAMALSTIKNDMTQERTKLVKPLARMENSSKTTNPPCPLISVTLDGSTYTSRQSVQRPITPPFSDNPTRKEAFFTSTISYFLDNRAKHREATRTAKRYCTEKVCSWRTPHSKRDFTLQTKRHGLEGASSISTLSVLPSEHTISVASVKCSQGLDGRVVYE